MSEAVQQYLKQKVYSVEDIVLILKKINFDVKKLTTDPRSDQESSYFPLEVMIKAVRYMN